MVARAFQGLRISAVITSQVLLTGIKAQVCSARLARKAEFLKRGGFKHQNRLCIDFGVILRNGASPGDIWRMTCSIPCPNDA